MLDLQVNKVIEAVGESTPFLSPARILWIDRGSNQVFLIRLLFPAKQPWVMGLCDLEAMLINGDVRPTRLLSSQFMLRDESEISEREKRSRDRKWKVIEPLIETSPPGLIFEPGSMGRLVSIRAEELGVSRKTIYRLLYRYWQFGQVQNSLLENREKCGAPGKNKTYKDGVIPGRPQKYQGEVVSDRTKKLDAADIKCIQQGYALFAKDKVGTMVQAHDAMMRKFYRLKEIGDSVDDRDSSILLPPSERPSLQQFIYWGRKSLDEIEVLKGRVGNKRYQKDHRPLVGTARDGLRGPCHRFEVDATVADIYLVSRYNRRWIIGRPIVYVIVDTYSGIIAGVHVGLEGPSWNGARQALFNAFTKKSDFCKLYGIEISDDEWPCYHLPNELTADRGELLSGHAEGIPKGLKLKLNIAPPFRPDWKSVVESRFKILNNEVQIHWTPGAVRTRELERGDRDYRFDAVLNLQEFTKIIINGILHYNRHHWLPDVLSDEMIADNVSPTPLSMWNWAMQNGIAEPNHKDEELVYLHLLPRDRGSIQKGGINFKGMFYTCNQAIEEHWFAKARNFGRKSIEIFYDPNYTQHVWIQGNDKHFIKCELRDSDAEECKYRLEEVIDRIEILKNRSPEQQEARIQSKAKIADDKKETIRNAQREKKDTPAESSKAKQTGNIRNNRARERDVERAEARVPEGLKPKRTTNIDAQSKQSNYSAVEYAGERGAEVIDLLTRMRPGKNKNDQ